MADHHYFTSSKARKDLSPVQNPLKRKRTDDSSLTEGAVTDPIITQNELIAQLIQQIGDMKIEIKRAQEMANGAIAVNPPTLNDMRPSFHPFSPNIPRQPIPISQIHPQPIPSPSPTFNVPSACPSPTNHQIPSSHYQHPQSPNIIIPNFQLPLSNYQTSPRTKVQIPIYPRRNHPNHHRESPPPQNNNNPPHPNAGRKPPREFTPLAESRTKLFERLSDTGLIQPIPPRGMSANSRFFKDGRICAYHSNSVGHDTEGCKALKHKIQDLIDQGRVFLVNKDPLPDHGENTTN